jgi:predicted nucleic acid-binding protein
MGRLRSALHGQKVYLDANIFIYAIEAIEPWAKELNDVFVGLKSSEFSAVTSNLSLAECLVMPFKNNRHDLVQVYRQTFLPRPYLEIAPIDIDVLIFFRQCSRAIKFKTPGRDTCRYSFYR